MNERQRKILEEISSNENLKVADLARSHNVSAVTIRSDLRLLSREGLIRRVHGGAENTLDDYIANRMKHNYKTKVNIAERAAEMIKDGETIMIESGSTNALLALALGKMKEVTIVSNSSYIAGLVSKFPNIKFVLLGGDYQPDSQVCIGPLARLALQSFYVDKVFIGSDGFSKETGFTCVDLQRAEIAAEMSRRANKTIILTDSSKFSSRGVAKQLSLAEVDVLITDDGIPANMRKLFEASHLELITVPKN